MTGHKRKWLVLLMLLSSSVGCGSGSPFDYVKVSGKLTYEDGTPIPSEGVILTFVPQEVEAIDEKFYPRSGVAYPSADGTFEVVTSYRYGDGIVQGKHKVLVSVRGMSFSQPGKGKKKQAEPLFDKAYTSQETTPLEVHTDDAPFVIQVKKRIEP